MRLFAALLIGLAACVNSASAKTLWHQLEDYTFEDYLAEYGKSYSGSEYNQRKAIFEDRLAEIQKHNTDPAQSYKKGVNHLSDLTDDEFTRMLGYKKHITFSSTTRVHKMKKHKESSSKHGRHHPHSHEQVHSRDWRKKGVVTAVKDQGQCGSCWSFGTTETIESHYAIKTGHLAVLSEQQILDCTPNPQQCGGTGGCGGGTPELAYTRLIKLGGHASEWTYPYRSYFGNNFKTCSFNATQTVPVATLSDYVVLPSNEYEPVLEAVANIGPTVIAVDASAWSSYESGVFTGCNATSVDLDHAVVIEGFGTDSQYGDYWLIRNSWSPSWGENGYIRLPRSSKTQCGTDYTPTDGVGCAHGPSQVTVCGACGLLYDVSYPLISN